MADTFTEFLNLTRPEIGASRDAWGAKLNLNMEKIDSWAKNINITVKNTVAKTGETGQTINGDLDINGGFKALLGANIPANKIFSFGNSRLAHTLIPANNGNPAVDYTFFQLGGSTLNIVDGANSYFMATINGDGIYHRAREVFHKGNLNPMMYADKTATSVQKFLGPLELNFNSVYMDLVFPDKIRIRQSVDTEGTYIISNGDTKDNRLTINNAGQIWTKQLGDFATYIENRGAAFTASARAGANADAAALYFPKYSGGRVEISSKPVISGNNAFLEWVYPGVSRWQVGISDKNLHVYLPDTNTQTHIFGLNGSFYTLQMGDVRDYIENRAKAYSDDAKNNAQTYASTAQNNAQNYTNNAFNIFRANTQTFTQDQYITKEYPTWHFLYPGVRDYGWQVREDARLHVWDYTNPGSAFSIGPDGSVSTRQLGDLNTRIESRGAAFASSARAGANADAAALYFPRNTGGRTEMTSKPVIVGGDAFSEWLVPNVVRWQVGVSDGKLRFYLPDPNSQTHVFGQDGSISTSQFGDLNTRIETRAKAFADARNVRLAFAGDVGTDWRNDGTYGEPFAGAVCTGVNHRNSAVVGMRWRYLQQQGTDGSFYTVAYN